MTAIPPSLPDYFVVDFGDGGAYDQGHLFRMEGDVACWDGVDHGHRFLLSSPPEVEGESLVISTEHGRLRLRPVQESDASWLGHDRKATVEALHETLRACWSWS